MQPVLISIVCPMYNGTEFIEGLIQCILSQTFSNWELIIVDDCSTDDSFIRANKHSASDERIKVLKLSKKSGGPAGPRNYGIEVSRGSFIAFIDVDDRWTQDKLARCSPHLTSHDVVYHGLRTQKSNLQFGRILTGRSVYLFPKLSMLLLGNHVPLSSALVKKEILQAVGGFDDNPNLKGVEDFDLWLRLAAFGCSFKRLKDTLGVYWAGGGNISSNTERMSSNLSSLYKKHSYSGSRLLNIIINTRLEFALARLRHIESKNNTAKSTIHIASEKLFDFGFLKFMGLSIFQKLLKFRDKN